jgi:hypothetical protein
VTLLFETYTEVPIRDDQQQRITEWLGEWAPETIETTTNLTTRESLEAGSGFDCCSTDEDDDSEVCTKLSQMNITNWIKSWGRESVSDLETSKTTDQKIFDQTNIQSKRDGLPNNQLS